MEGSESPPADYVAYPVYDIDTFKEPVGANIERNIPELMHDHGNIIAPC